MSTTYKVWSATLTYPTAEFQSGARELIEELNGEHILPAKQRAAVAALITDIAAADLLEAQASYVDLFDRTRSLSLHLFEHVHGESRDRGQAMDRIWEEAEVRFGPGNAASDGCPRADDILQRINIPTAPASASFLETER